MLGLVLEGGGAKGSFHAGVLKALFERGYHFDGVAGTSIGAINGALVAQGDFDKCYQLWQTVTPSMLFDVDDEKVANLVNSQYDRSTVMYFLRFLRSSIANRGLPMDKAEAFLKGYVDEQKLRNSPIDFGIVTVATSDDWMPVEIFKEEIPQGMMVKYILASAYLPVFKRSTINGKRFIDGGIYDNLPINPLVRRGYNNIIAVRTMSNMPHSKVIDRSIKVSYISPSESLGNTLSFSSERLNHNLNLGYYDALRFTDGLSGKKYYFESLTDGEFRAYLENAYGVPLFKEWAELLKVRGNKERIIITLTRHINSVVKSDHPDYRAFTALLEPFAAACGLERFKIYSLKEMLGELKANFNKINKSDFDKSKEIDAVLWQIFAVLMENTNI
ncbi:MAG: patatin-like phospholipase family protein [Clostridia bacterium]